MPKISAYDELSAVASGDLVPIVDVSDTSQAATGTTKYTTINTLSSAVAALLSTVYIGAPGGVDDTALFTAAEASLPSSGGRIMLNAGDYALPAGYSFSKPVILEGHGMGNPYGWNISGYTAAYPPPRLLRGITTVTVPSTTASGLTFTQHGSGIQDLAIINTSSTAPSSGVGADFTAAALCRIERCAVTGFYDCVGINNGGLWAISASYISNPVRYGIRIRNDATPDEGDGFIGNGTSIYAINRDGAAGINWESGGGTKISGVKINGAPGGYSFPVGIRYNCDGAAGGSSVGTVTGCSIENVDTCIEMARQGASGVYHLVTIIGNEFGYATDGFKVSTAGYANTIVSGNIFVTVTNPVVINYGSGFQIGPNIVRATSSGTTVVSVGANAGGVYVAPQQVEQTSGYTTLVADSSSTVLADFRAKYVLGSITASSGALWTLVVKTDRAGTFSFSIAGTATGVGPFSFSGVRSYTRTSGTVTVATVGTDSQIGAASTDVDLVIDTATSGHVGVGVKLKSGATATNLRGMMDITVNGDLSEFRQVA